MVFTAIGKWMLIKVWLKKYLLSSHPALTVYLNSKIATNPHGSKTTNRTCKA
jgi:hypothetical protein